MINYDEDSQQYQYALQSATHLALRSRTLYRVDTQSSVPEFFGQSTHAWHKAMSFCEMLDDEKYYEKL